MGQWKEAGERRGESKVMQLLMQVLPHLGGVIG